MKDIEVNSDMYTVIAAAAIIVLMLFGFIFDVRALAKHEVGFPELHFWDYGIALFQVYAAIACSERRLRSEYPYGVAGLWLNATAFLIRISAHWLPGAGSQHALWTAETVANIAVFGLILMEVIRWFRRRVRLA